MLLGDLTVGRLLSAEWRRRCAFPLRLLLAAPYLAFALHPPTAVAAVAVFVASAGFAATLPSRNGSSPSPPSRCAVRCRAWSRRAG